MFWAFQQNSGHCLSRHTSSWARFLAPLTCQFVAEIICRDDQLRANAGLECGVARTGHDDVLRFRPSSMQIVGGNDGTNRVVTALNDNTGNMPDRIDIVE